MLIALNKTLCHLKRRRKKGERVVSVKKKKRVEVKEREGVVKFYTISLSRKEKKVFEDNFQLWPYEFFKKFSQAKKSFLFVKV